MINFIKSLLNKTFFLFKSISFIVYVRENQRPSNEQKYKIK